MANIFLSGLSKLILRLFNINPPGSEISKIVDLLEDAEELPDISISLLSQKKMSFFKKSLDSGIATLYLDPRVFGVSVPKGISIGPVLVLNYSYKYGIADFSFDDFGVVASLTFSGSPFRCVVPWKAVFGIGNQGEGTFLQFQDPPPETVQQHQGLRQIQGGATPEKSVETPEQRRSKFKTILGGKS